MKLKTRSSLEHLALGRLGSSRNGEGREALGGRIGEGGVGSVATINSATELGHSDGEDCREKFGIWFCNMSVVLVAQGCL